MLFFNPWVFSGLTIIVELETMFKALAYYASAGKDYIKSVSLLGTTY